MSGGFFRGTSSEQDSRFSNKHAKLLKTQKFAPELFHPVDVTKVQMDVIRPWIATRATELLGFEDEVLINFVYGLLDGKEVDGKQIQIQLTGFLEKNTGKFMKELWGLLLSAQNNASGIPQQFLDAKEEEMKMKKVESDRITQEIQKRKEKQGREFEQEKQKRMDTEAGNSRSANAVSGLSSKHSLARVSSVQSEKEGDVDTRQSPILKGRLYISPHLNDNSLIRRTSSPSRSFSKSASKSGSSKEGRPRSVSVSSQSRWHSTSPRRRYHSPPRPSISSERRYKSPARRSISPHQRYSPRNYWSPSRRRSPYARRISPSISRHRSPSPIQRRSPYGPRSPSFLRRRSPPSHHRSPIQNRRRSPFPSRHRRSPSPTRRRSPSLTRRRRSPSPPRRRRSPSPKRRWRSPSPTRRRRSPSPTHRRRSPSPTCRKSPVRRRSLSPAAHRSLSPPRRRSPPYRSPQQKKKSPLHSPRKYGADSQMSLRARKRSRSPYRGSISSYPTRRDSSRETDSRTNGFDSTKRQDEYASERDHENRSLVCRAVHREVAEHSDSRRKVLDPISCRLPVSSRSSSRDSRDQNDIHDKDHGVPSENSLEQSDSPSPLRRTSPRRNRRSENTVKQTEKRMPHNSRRTDGDKEQASPVREDAYHRNDSSSKKGTRGHPTNVSLKRKESEHKSDVYLPKRHVREVSGSPDKMEHGLGRVRVEKDSVDVSYERQHLAKMTVQDASASKVESTELVPKGSHADIPVSDVEKQPKSRSDAYKESHYGMDSVKKSNRKMDTSSQVHSIPSDSEETDTQKYRSTEKRRHRKYDKYKRDSDDSSESDSHSEDKKEAKRRRKEEKRLRKEERHRKREEKHRKRSERRAGKHKMRSMDTVTPPSDFVKDHNDAGKSDDEAVTRKASHLADAGESESEEKKLEIELREKALETLRARKAIGH